ncbi:MAG: MFS transporter [Stellaceae bacterium]
MGLNEQKGQALINRMVWRTVPLLTLCYVAAVIDRSNIGFAKLQMIRDLHMSEATFGLGSSLYFIGYLLFEIPSILLMIKYGTRSWLARIMFTWGLATILLGLSTTGWMFYTMRFVLGIAEAGLHPGIFYFLMLWFPPSARAQVFALFQMGGSLGNILAALAGGSLLDLNGTFGLAGWQWVFIATGIPPILLAAFVLRYVTNRPSEASYLTQDEKEWLETNATRAPPERPRNPFAVLWDPRVLFFGVLETLVLTSLYGIIYWLPTVIRGFGVTGTQIGLLTAIPWTLAAILMSTLPAWFKREKTVLVAFSSIAAIGAASFLVSMLVSSNTLRFVAMTIGTPCIQLLIPCTWSIISRYLAGAKAAPSIAAITMVSTLGGFFAQNLMPWAGRVTGHPIYSMLVPAACLGILVIAPLFMVRYADRREPAVTAV